MYPDWPESDADLVPLPLCDGPKLKAFDFQGPQSIRFIDYIGSGLHSHVLKIQIKDQLYALKLFVFPYDWEWNGPRGEYSLYDRELYTAFYNYHDPFSCECRAYGRLQETGNEDLAVQAFGYILLDEEHERKLKNHFDDTDFDFEGLLDEDDGPKDCRSRFLGKSGKPPPVRGIVKALGRVEEEETVRAPLLRKILNDTTKLQKLGIFCLDTKIEQLIDGKLGDLSVAVTVPHFLTNPELNPYLTPEMISVIESYTFRTAMDDYRRIDWIVSRWNTQYAKEKGKISVSAFPDLKGCQNRYNLRSKAAEGRVFTFVDPRKYEWKSRLPSSKASGGRIAKKNRSEKVQGKQRVIQGQGSLSRRNVTSRPSLWHYRPRDEKEEKELRKPFPVFEWMEWDFKQGVLFPCVGGDCEQHPWNRQQ